MIEIKGTQPSDLYSVKDGADATEESLAVIDANGDVLDATDAAAVKVIGLFARIDAAGENAEVRDGVFLLANSATNAFARKDRGATAYVEDKDTVASDGGTNSVVAGIVIDITADGVFVDTRPAAIAAG